MGASITSGGTGKKELSAKEMIARKSGARREAARPITHSYSFRNIGDPGRGFERSLAFVPDECGNSFKGRLPEEDGGRRRGCLSRSYRELVADDTSSPHELRRTMAMNVQTHSKDLFDNPL